MMRSKSRDEEEEGGEGGGGGVQPRFSSSCFDAATIAVGKEVKKAAAKEPEWSGYRYWHITTNLKAKEEGPWPTHMQERSGRGIGATKVDVAATWSDVALADDAEAPYYNNQSLGARLSREQSTYSSRRSGKVVEDRDDVILLLLIL